MQHRSRHLLVATDIFGATAALRSALAQLQSASAEIQLQISLCQPDSCDTDQFVFTDDQLAYQAFLRHGGLDRYQSQVATMLEQHQPDLVLGFSAGAAALWSALSTAKPPVTAATALLCYGGQIRQYHHVAPGGPVTCLWSDEKHFDVVALQQQLSQYHNLQQRHWPLPHGFINPHSAGFDALAAAEFWRRCQAWLHGETF
jgi:hypothetical protein